MTETRVQQILVVSIEKGWTWNQNYWLQLMNCNIEIPDGNDELIIRRKDNLIEVFRREVRR